MLIPPKLKKKGIHKSEMIWKAYGYTKLLSSLKTVFIAGISFLIYSELNTAALIEV